jgi:Tfp pilus assembly protein PilX
MTSTPRGMLRNDRGSTIVLVLLLVVLLTITVAAGFARSSSEQRTTSDMEAQTGALMVAQSGLERYLFQVTTLPSTFPSSQTFTLNGGTADVTLHRYHLTSGAGDPTIYAIRSKGRYTRAKRYDARATVAERSVSQLLQWQTATIDVDAAFTSLSGVHKNGSSGTVSGIDQCGAQGTIPGVAVPDGTASQSGGGGSPGAYIDGSPDNAPQYMGTAGPAGSAQSQVDIDWASIMNGTMLSPDYLVNRTVTPYTGTIPTATSAYTNWPVLRVNGNLTNGDNFTGKGVLIVTGDADLTNITWRGLVLVGGVASVSGNATRVFGTLITGLNVKLGMTVNQAAVGNGNFLVQYNSCDIASALNRLGGWQRIANTWTDNWPTY